eukprot:TRINITY_DN412_c0_g2_i2.p1 TRINITY_DN412_c0_g2~~TRINITY_DN412_c0_g2_i2.p1  ORF type:complete len:1479 (+),score=286.19 TRINITY_DN412_c0_g2_i2:385-4437(+)
MYPSSVNYTKSIGATSNWEDTRGVISTCPGIENDGYLYISFDKSAGNTYIFIDTSKQWVEQFPITYFTPFDYGFEILSSSVLQCNTTLDFVCNRRGTAGPTFTEDCFRYWQSWPVESSNPFFPRPPWTFGSDSWHQINLLDPLPQQLPNKYSMAALLELSIDSKLITADSKKVYLTSEQLPKCTMLFTGKLAIASGEPIIGRVSFKQQVPSCNYTKYVSLNTQLRTYLNNMTQSFSSNDLKNYRYMIDMLSFNDSWVGCSELASELTETQTLSHTVYTNKCVHAYGTAEYNSNPCCNEQLQWSQSCSYSYQTSQVEEFTSSAIDLVEEKCFSPTCVSQLLSEISEVNSNVNDVTTGCDSILLPRNLFDVQHWKPYRECRDRAFGIDQTVGVPCDHDLDCDNGAKCGIWNGAKRCLYNYNNDRVDMFFQCLIDNLDSLLKLRIRSVMNIPYDNVISWRSGFTEPMCIDSSNATMAMDGRSSWVFKKNGVSVVCSDYWCPTSRCVDSQCQLPFHCDAGQICLKGWEFVSNTQSSCESISYCNWMNCDSSDPNCSSKCLNFTNPDFCGVCEDNVRCREIPTITDQPTCASSILCRLNNGSEIFVSTEDECTSMMTCNMKCNGGTCTTATDCLGQGVCSDAFLFENPTPSNGRCITKPLVPFVFLNGCTGRSAVDATTGGINYVISTPYGCLDPNVSLTNCTGTWVVPATSEAECTSRGSVCWITYADARVSNGAILTYRNESDCLLSDGRYLPFFNWTGATWRGGQVRRLSWKPRTYQQRYSWSDGFNILSLYDAISSSLEWKYAFQIQSTSQCRYNQLRDLYRQLACGCTSAQNPSCYSRPPPATNAISQVCGGGSLILKTPSSYSYFDEESLDIGNCTTVSVSNTQIQEFRYTSIETLSSFFLQLKESTDWKFRNRNDALIGQVVGRGTSFSFNTTKSGSPIFVPRKVILCLLPSSEVPDLGFPVADIGFQSSDISNIIIPLELNVTIDISYGYCVTIEDPQPNGIYLPIRRVENYLEQTRQLFSIGEKVLMGILLIAFAVDLSYSSYKLGYGLYYKFPSVTIASFSILFIFSLARVILFAMAIADVVLDSLPAGLSYVIVELPSYLFFSVTSLFIISWFYVVKRSKKLGLTNERVQHLFPIFAAVVNITMYSILLLMIILYETIPEPDPIICRGSDISDHNANRRTVGLVYRVIVFLVSGIIGIFFLLYGTRVYYLLGKERSQEKKSRYSQRIKIFLATLTCSIAMLVQSLYLLITSFVYVESNYLSMCILLISEALPIFFLLFVLKSKGGKHFSSSSSSVSQRRRTTSGMPDSHRDNSVDSRGPSTNSTSDRDTPEPDKGEGADEDAQE